MINVKDIHRLSELGEQCSNVIAPKINTSFITPIASAYTSIGNDWEGSAAARHLPNIKLFYDDMVKMHDYMIDIGNGISQVAEKFDEMEQRAGGDSRGIVAVIKPRYAGTLTAIPKDPGKSIKITQTSVDAGKELKLVASGLQGLITQIDEVKNEVFSNWLEGGNPQAIHGKIQESLNKMSDFKKVVDDVVNEIVSAHNLFQGVDLGGESARISGNVDVN